MNRRRFIKSAAGLLVPATLAHGRGRSTGMCGSTVLVSRPSGDPDVATWVTRVQGQGSDVSPTVQGYYDTFATGLKADGLFTKFHRMGVYSGDTLAALTAPFINTVGDTTDTVFNFVSGDYTSAGLAGGATKAIKTGLDPSLIVGAVNDFSFGVYCVTGGSSATIDVGATSTIATDQSYIYWDSTNGSVGSLWNTNNQIIVASDTTHTGFYVNSRTASNVHKFFKNGSQIGSTNTGSAGTVNNVQYYVHAQNNGGVLTLPTTRRLALYFFAVGLTAAEVSTLYTRVQTLQTSLGRQV